MIRIMGGVPSAASVLEALESIRRSLEINPKESGQELSEGLHYIDREPLRAFFVIDEGAMIVEVTDFRVL
jgi:hypothetical protein